MNMKIKIVSRKSNLALIQVNEVLQELSGIDFDIKTLDSFGDKHKEISLMDCKIPDFFTRELDDELLRGLADISIHSAKDLPFPFNPNLEVIALTKQLDGRDCLVTKDNILLKDMKPLTKIGASSTNRICEIKNIRDDLDFVSIRGSIEERLKYIENGEADSVVVAVCALKRLGLEHKITQILPFPAHPLQGMLAVISQKNKPLLKKIFRKIDNRLNYGKVYLIGAGVGDIDFLTVKAVKVLKKAGVIYYDDLVNPQILDFCIGEKIYCGKRKGAHHLEQEKINKLLYESAISGKTVIRLKSGDPFIFGRGGEETGFLMENLVDVEIIPGITSVSGAASIYNIPVTLRGVSDSLHLFTGHNSSDGNSKGIKPGTSVYYMAGTKLEDLKSKLIISGFKKNSDVALVSKLGFLDEKIEITSLERVELTKLETPLLVVIGDSVKHIRIKDKILYTGLDIDNFNVKFIERLINYPLIKVQKFENQDPLVATDYDAFVFTSKNAVKFFYEKYSTNGKPIFAIGNSTKLEIEKYGDRALFIPDKADSIELSKLIKTKDFKNILYPCSNLSENDIHKIDCVKKHIIYEVNYIDQQVLDFNEFSGIIFTSPSTIDSFYKIYKRFPDHFIYYVLGVITMNKLLEYGIKEEVIVNVCQI